jgi:hypothetical protein
LGLLERLTPGRLRTALKDALLRWPSLDEGRQERFLATVDDCSRALDFARLMAGRYRLGVVGGLAGVLGSVGVWSVCLLVFGWSLKLWEWAGVFVAGLLAGGLLFTLLSGKRDAQWVKGTLLPEAERSGVRPEALLAVLEGAAAQPAGDELRQLRPLAPPIRAALASSGKAGLVFRFGAP